jgi:putative membrane protein
MRVILIAGTIAATSASLAAHGSAADAGRTSGWDVAVLLMLGAGAALYAIGSSRLAARGARVRRAERGAFWVGWAALVVAVSPPFDRIVSVLFSAHMAQHELLMLVGAPLGVVGRPIVPWLWALPGRMRPATGAGLRRDAIVAVWQWLTMPPVAVALHGAVVWIWHAPVLYEAALRSDAIHALQHAMFVGSAVCFWWGLVYGRYGRAGYGAAAFYVFLTSLHTGILGAIFTLSQAPFYSVYANRTPAVGADAAVDQQLAGLYMWIPAGMILMLAGLGLLVAWLAESDRRSAVSFSPSQRSTQTR